MGFDVVFPNGNEKEFIEMAEKLGHNSLCFVYKAVPARINYQTKLKIIYGALSNGRDYSKLKKKADLVFFKASDNLRGVIESKQADIIFDLELSWKKDNFHYRNSGLNQVLCKLMAGRGVLLGISFNTILNSSGAKRASSLGRIMQNLRFVKKYKVPVLCASFAKKPNEMRSGHDLGALLLCLGQ